MEERQKGLISIIVPCRVKSAISDFCIDGIGKQTYSNLEVIIVEGSNVNKNRNDGFKLSRGEYVFFLDNDIKLEPECLEKMFNVMDGKEKDRVDIAYCHYYKEGKLNGKHLSRPWDFEEMKKLNYISTMSLVRASRFVYFDEEVKRLQDWDLWIRMGKNGSQGVMIDEVLFTAHYASDGISLQSNYAEWFQKVRSKNGL